MLDTILSVERGGISMCSLLNVHASHVVLFLSFGESGVFGHLH